MEINQNLPRNAQMGKFLGRFQNVNLAEGADSDLTDKQ